MKFWNTYKTETNMQDQHEHHKRYIKAVIKFLGLNEINSFYMGMGGDSHLIAFENYVEFLAKEKADKAEHDRIAAIVEEVLAAKRDGTQNGTQDKS